MPRRRYRAIGDGFCSVKVKLTKGLGIGAGLLVSAHSIARRFSASSGEIVTQGGVKQVWSSRGKGGCQSPRGLARKDQHRRGRAFSEPSLCSFVTRDSYPGRGGSDQSRRPAKKAASANACSRAAATNRYGAAAPAATPACGANSLINPKLAGANA
jgi:hypothetical protein